MARSRRGPRTRLDAGERRALSALKKAGVYKPKGTPSPRSLHRKLRQPGMAEVAAGRAKALKVGRRTAREYTTLPRARDRVIMAQRPGRKVYARKGEVFEAETDTRGRIVPGGEKRRVAKVPFAAGAPPPRPIGPARGRQGYVITVNGYPSGVFFASLEQAQAYARRFYQRPQRASRLDPDALVVSIDPMRRSEWDEIMDEMDERRRQRRAEKRARDREQARERRQLARSVRLLR